MKEKYQIRTNGFKYAIWYKGFFWGWNKLFQDYAESHHTFSTLEEAQRTLDEHIQHIKENQTPYDKVIK